MEPWRWLSDADVVAIKHPSGEEIGYCAVLGNAGFEYGLGVYVGDEGLASYLALATDEVEPESDAALETTHALSAILADREDLYAMDRATIRRLGIRVPRARRMASVSQHSSGPRAVAPGRR